MIKIPFIGATLTVFDTYAKGFKPYVKTPLRVKVLQIRWRTKTWHIRLRKEEKFRPASGECPKGWVHRGGVLARAEKREPKR